MPTKKQIITIGVLCIVAFGLGYWDGPFEKDSGQRAEVVAPTVITNVVTNIVRVLPPVKPNPKIEDEIRRRLQKPTGKVTKADLEKVTRLSLWRNQLTSVQGLEKLTQLKVLILGANQLTNAKGLEKLTQLEWLDLEENQLTSVKGLEKLTQLTELFLRHNPDLTKAQIDELKKALPKCDIRSNPTK